MFKKYTRKSVAELAPWTKSVYMKTIGMSIEDVNNGSPKEGDMIARNPKNHDDKWLVSKKYFEDNFEEKSAK